jgi:hypothetical protein
LINFSRQDSDWMVAGGLPYHSSYSKRTVSAVILENIASYAVEGKYHFLDDVVLSI